jgi:hypothetical protein
MTTEKSGDRPVLDYGSPVAGTAGGSRAGVQVLCVLTGIIGLVSFALGCGTMMLLVFLQPPGDQSRAFTAASIYLAIAAVCAVAAIRWGRRAFSKRRTPEGHRGTPS